MVLAPARFPFDDDGGILALLRGRRAEADTAMARSLTTASLSLLTLVVAVLFAQSVLHGASGRVIEVLYIPEPPSHPGQIFEPIPGVFTPPIVVPSKAVEVEPVDETSQTDAPPVINGTESGGTAGQGEAQAEAEGSGGKPGAIPDDPTPTQFVFYEVAPEIVTRVAPDYPALARDAGMEGRVTVRLLVGVDGRVKRAEIESSSALFDEAALAASRQWIFTPALSNHHPVAVWVRVPIRFQLH